MDNTQNQASNKKICRLWKFKNPFRSSMVKYSTYFVASIFVSFFYIWVYTSVLNFELPKTIILKKENEGWKRKVKLMSSRLDEYTDVLENLGQRDDDVYRSIFGLDYIPKEVRNAGFGGVNRYLWLDEALSSGVLKDTYMQLDILTKKSYVQSLSFEEIALLVDKADNMASCIPAIIPVQPDKEVYRLSSSFGYRRDPFTGYRKLHTGMDFALKVGNSVYATGDGKVEKVEYLYFGYGKNVTINHGFGYKTRYAHMDRIDVREGDIVKRGDVIGLSGNSGRSSGPHLHYEVKYRNTYVNPYNYMDLAFELEGFNEMVDANLNKGGNN